jgi:thiol-disulfide isomerase/thioredoxin
MSPPGKKYVADRMLHSEYQVKKQGDLACLFFKQECPYCRDFKPTWNRVARKIEKRWPSRSVAPPEVRRLDVNRYNTVQKNIGFPSVPCIALYKTGKPPVFLTTSDRSLSNMVKLVENYYLKDRLPPSDECVIGTEAGQWPQEPEKEKAPPPQEIKSLPKSPRPEKPETPVKLVVSSTPRSPVRPPLPSFVTARAASVTKSTKPAAVAVNEIKFTVSAKPPEDEIFARLLAKLMKNKDQLQ